MGREEVKSHAVTLLHSLTICHERQVLFCFLKLDKCLPVYLMYAELAPPKNSVGPSYVESKLGKLMMCSKCAEMASRLTLQE